MSQTAPTSVTAPLPYRNPWQRWKDFWFHPSDPTTLAFIRIATGLLVLYIQLTYSLDLQAFFGEHGWYANRFIERERHEAPYFVPPFNDEWKDPQPVYAQISDFPHRRAALMQYLRALPADPVQREREIAYLNRVHSLPDAVNQRLALEYVQRMGLREEELERHMTVLAGGTVSAESGTGKGSKSVDLTPSYASATPRIFLDMPPDQKAVLASEVRAFWHSLARIKWLNPDRDRSFVFNHFVEVGGEARRALLDFMAKLPADDVKRKELLDYLEYWNNDPTKAYRRGAAIFSLWFHVKDPTQMALLHAGVLVLIVLFIIGLFTRVTSVLVWLATVSYIHRTQQVLFGMDTMMNILLFYLMIGNCGAALSVDRLIARYRAVRASLRRTGTIDANTQAFLGCPPPSMSAGFALRLIQIHFCFIYVAAGLSKLKGAMWWNGQAFWEVVVNPEFTLMQYEWYQTGLRWLASSKPFYHLITIVAVWGTLFIEIAGPFLFWTRLRWLVILLATVMHAAIGVLMGLNLFELLMIVMLISFLPDRVVRDRFRGAPDLPRLGISYNPTNALHARAVALVLAADVDNQVAPSFVANAAAVSVDDASQTTTTGPQGIATLFRHLRLPALFAFITWIPGVRGLLATLIFPTAPASMATSVKTGVPRAKH